MDQNKLKSEHKKRKNEIKARLEEFKNAKDYFYELAFCVLTPQSNAFKCDACIQELKKVNFQKNNIQITSILQKYTRFHKNKSNYLIEFKENHKKIFIDLNNETNSKKKRSYIVEHVKGIGLKEASHFLRNTGHRNLAILDRHILKNLKKLKIINEIPKSLTSKVYFDIEQKFLNFSQDINISMDELDLLFWSLETGKIFK